MECITTLSYSFLLNDEAVGCVIPQRCMRQGEPISPYIFIVRGEVLSGLCIKAQEEGSLLGIIVSRNSLKINHLLFADDTMFFVKTSQQSVDALKDILIKYETASGQTISPLKSSITFSKKTPMEVKIRVQASLGITKEGGVGKYLGLPEHFGRRKKDLFTSIVDSIRQRAASWSSNK